MATNNQTGGVAPPDHTQLSYQLNYVHFSLKPSRVLFLNQKLSSHHTGRSSSSNHDVDDPSCRAYHEFIQAIHHNEKLNEREAEIHFTKAIALNPNHFFTWFLRGEMHQALQKSLAIECFERAKICIAEYPQEQEYPRNRSYEELNEQERVLYREQLILLCDALILDTKGDSIQATSLFKKGVAMHDEYVNKGSVIVGGGGDQKENRGESLEENNDDGNDDDDDDAEQEEHYLRLEGLNEEVERIQREEDDFIMSFLYIYWNYSLQRSLWDMEAMIVACMKGLAYGPPFSVILPLWDIFRFLHMMDNVTCINESQFYKDALAIDELRSLQGARFFFNDMFIPGQDMRGEEEAIRIAEYLYERHKSMAMTNLFYALAKQKQGDKEAFNYFIMRAFEMDPGYYILEQMFDLTNLDLDPKKYMTQTEALLSLAERYIVKDYEVTECAIEIRFWQTMFNISLDLKNIYESVPIDEDAATKCEKEWDDAWDLYRQKKDLDTFLSKKEQIFRPESRYSKQRKEILFRGSSAFYDVDIFTRN